MSNLDESGLTVEARSRRAYRGGMHDPSHPPIAPLTTLEEVQAGDAASRAILGILLTDWLKARPNPDESVRGIVEGMRGVDQSHPVARRAAEIVEEALLNAQASLA